MKYFALFTAALMLPACSGIGEVTYEPPDVVEQNKPAKIDPGYDPDTGGSLKESDYWGNLNE